MNKKLIAGIAMSLALVLGAGGFVVFQNQAHTEEFNNSVTAELEQIKDITLTEGESLPNVDNVFDGLELINLNSVEADIQNVDVTTPGEYEILYSFTDTEGQERQKTVNCTVLADLKEHVTGMGDLTVDYGEELPPANVTYDEYVDSVVRDDSLVDITVPGTYPITYTILGMDGEMEEVEYLATVLDTRPDPTPTPTIMPIEDQTLQDDTKPVLDEGSATGNIQNGEDIEQVVKTGDETQTGYWLYLFAAGLVGIITMMITRFQKKN